MYNLKEYHCILNFFSFFHFHFYTMLYRTASGKTTGLRYALRVHILLLSRTVDNGNHGFCANASFIHLTAECKSIQLCPAPQLQNVKVYSPHHQYKVEVNMSPVLKYNQCKTVNIKNKGNQKQFPMEASRSQLCAATLNSPHSMPLIRHPDRHAAFCWHFSHTHTKSLTPICTAKLTLPDYGNRLSPMCRQEGRFSTKAWEHSPSHKNTHSRAVECQGRHQIVLPCWRLGPSFIPFSHVWC